MKGIVFEGGGDASFCHIGVLKYIQEQKIRFDYYAGSSSGSIIAVFAAAGYPAAKIEKIALNLELPKINFFSGCYNLINNFGWLSTQFIADIIIEHFGDITMAEFEKKYGKKIIITACKNFQEEYFTSFNSLNSSLNFKEGKEVKEWGVKNNTNEKLAEVVARSCAFPYVFARRDGYSDGGIINNFPFNYLVNLIGEKNVTGVYLRHYSECKPVISTNIFNFTYNLFNCISNDHSLSLLSKYSLKNIMIIKTDLTTFNNTKENKIKGVEEGYETALKFYKK